jgi:hypothetical protein
MAGDKSSIGYLERLSVDETDSKMVMQQVETALHKLQELYGSEGKFD